MRVPKLKMGTKGKKQREFNEDEEG